MITIPQPRKLASATGAILALLVLFSPVPAQSEVKRCTTSDGLALYTDRSCSDLDAVQDTRPPGSDGASSLHRTTCARNVQDLVHEVTSAIDSGDVNRLAGLYHWAGMSGQAGYAVMAQLDDVVHRPLIEIVPVAAGDDDGDWQYPRTVHDPIALRVEQTLPDTSTPLRTMFGMHQHFGCYWIKS